MKKDTPIVEQKDEPVPVAASAAREVTPTIEESPGVAKGPAGFSIACSRCETANVQIMGARRLPQSEGGSWRVQFQCKTCGQVSPE